ncbi:hypothetical protein Q428_14945 [Fervidicella metallireducens AeB]|uniref:Uncharacterized protein n=1 Tax=Fervidicella metallireducens AeB TaxID=1403537 RepID=A0A017RQY4_9CLOT|nr:hypothetical protein [Fervidicella metallireducens]EYE87153.1 hypothetical protein Q428_14945 [Fervidicella metallireducens AeB]
MVQNRERRKRYIYYLIGYMVAYFITLSYNSFDIFSISPVNLMSLVIGFGLGTALYYGLKPGGFYKYSLEMLKQILACIFIFIIALTVLMILQNSFGLNSKFFIGG